MSKKVSNLNYSIIIKQNYLTNYYYYYFKHDY